MPQLSSQFKQRAIFSAFGVFVLGLAITLSFMPLFGLLFLLIMGGSINLALWEYYQLVRAKGFNPMIGWGMGCTTAYLILLYLALPASPFVTFLPIATSLAFILIAFFIHFGKKENAIGDLAVTAFGLIYLSIPLSYALQIDYFYPIGAEPDGRLWLAYAFVTTKITDIGAYFVGKTFGCNKLVPLVSPQKTVEGAIGGWIAAVATSFAFAYFLGGNPAFSLTITQSLWMGALIGILAQIGDLAESLLKRDAGVKDSNHLPGLGGMLDVVDSLVFTLPLVYVLL